MDGTLKRGLSLAEVVLSLGLFTMVVLGFISLITAGLRLNLQGDQMSSATQSGRTLMETVKQRGYDRISPGTYDGRLSSPPPPNATTGFPPSPYPTSGVYQIVVTAADYAAGIRSVKVDVYWGPRSKVSLFTLVHQ